MYTNKIILIWRDFAINVFTVIRPNLDYKRCWNFGIKQNIKKKKLKLQFFYYSWWLNNFDTV